MKLQISTIAETTYTSDNVRSCTIPTADGEITVLNRHISLVSLLQPGVIKVVHTDESVEYLAVSTGIIEVRTAPNQPTQVIVLADQADRAGSLDLSVVEAAKAQAESALQQQQTLSEEEYKTLVADLAMQEARIKAGSRI
jgi:F-type H+-transporting ATPase subunit epsilon